MRTGHVTFGLAVAALGALFFFRPTGESAKKRAAADDTKTVTVATAAPARATAVVAYAMAAPVKVAPVIDPAPVIQRGSEIDNSDIPTNLDPGEDSFYDRGRPTRVTTLVKVGPVRAGVQRTNPIVNEKRVAEILEKAALEIHAAGGAVDLTDDENGTVDDGRAMRFQLILEKYQKELRPYVKNFIVGRSGQWALAIDTTTDWDAKRKAQKEAHYAAAARMGVKLEE